MSTSYKLTAEEVANAIAGHDLRTYRGWKAAATALLADAPEWTGIKQVGGFVLKVDGNVCGCAEYNDANAVYSQDDLFDFDNSAWGTDSWDGTDAEENCRDLQRPVFVALNHE